MAASAGSSKGSRWDGCLLLEALEGRPGCVMSVSNEAIVATHSTQLLTESGILFGTALNVGWPQANNANFHSPKLRASLIESGWTKNRVETAEIGLKIHAQPDLGGQPDVVSII